MSLTCTQLSPILSLMAMLQKFTRGLIFVYYRYILYMMEKRYCICCGEEVPCYKVERNEKIEVLCSYCGFSIEVKKLWDGEGFKEEERDLKKDIPQETELVMKRKISVKVETEKRKETLKDVAFVAEDSDFLKTLLKEIIIKKSLAQDVITVTNGLDLISEFTRAIEAGRRPLFAIVDLSMPVMDGLTAVKTIRSIEEKMSIDRMPVVFFSAIKADEDFKKQMELLRPANYINKGSSEKKEDLVQRIEALITFVSEKCW